tara:strand:+ start:2173 stop:2559 length:387 start_codon:yes stop_codon:yes gene_type:complete
MNNGMNDIMNSKFFDSMNRPANLKYGMGNGVPGSFDNLKLKSNKKVETETLEGKFYVPQGTPLPLKHEVMYVPLPKESMFYFNKNKSSQIGCASSFSTSNGSVCTTQEQRDFIGQHRGGNKNYFDDSF